MIDLEFSLPPTDTRLNDQGDAIKYDYKFNAKKKVKEGESRWELDKESGRVIRFAVTEADKLAIKREVVNMLNEEDQTETCQRD
jgi:hypothetical protein